MFGSQWQRRDFIKAAGASVAAAGLSQACAQVADEAARIRVLNPRGRVPLSFIIDDSTCLVNMGHFCMPQFAEAWPDRSIYKQPWKKWPREIPDAFVREFGEWCAEHSVKGKYSIVPYPACVGWLDRGLPGWSRSELNASLKLVRDLMVPNWDIHPEMITHTRVIDLKTGRPVADANPATMENSYPQTEVSVDYLASYLAFSLRILKNCGLPCEGITTPGGFGNLVKDKLPIAVHQAVRDVYGTDLPHYFKYISSGDESTAPKLEYVDSSRSVDKLTMNVPAGTGDWFGGWEGTRTSEGHRYCNEDAAKGRMVELIERGEPAVMLCHWPGMYCNGGKAGFIDFQNVVLALAERFRNETHWMKVSEIGRYYAAKELTKVSKNAAGGVELEAPFSCGDFTIELEGWSDKSAAVLSWQRESVALTEVRSVSDLVTNTFVIDRDRVTFCIDLPSGRSRIAM